MLLSAVGPLTATSANVHGGPQPIKIEKAVKQFGDRIKYYIEADDEVKGLGSTVIDFSGERPKILREGTVHRERIEKWLTTH